MLAENKHLKNLTNFEFCVEKDNYCKISTHLATFNYIVNGKALRKGWQTYFYKDRLNNFVKMFPITPYDFFDELPENYYENMYRIKDLLNGWIVCEIAGDAFNCSEILKYDLLGPYKEQEWIKSFEMNKI